MNRFMILAFFSFPIMAAGQSAQKSVKAYDDKASILMFRAVEIGGAYACGVRPDAWVHLALQNTRDQMRQGAAIMWPTAAEIQQPVVQAEIESLQDRINQSYLLGLRTGPSDCADYAQPQIVAAIDASIGWIP